MPSPAYFLMLATLLPLGGFGLLLFSGKRLGTPLAGWVATALIGLSFSCSMVAMIGWFQGGHYLEGDWGKGQLPVYLSMKWLPIGSAYNSNGISQDHLGYLDLVIYIDSLTVLLFAVVTLVALLVYGFGIGFMWRERRYPLFFAYLGLLCFSTLGLILSATLLQLFIFWQLIGISCYLLIGFHDERKLARRAATQAMIIARIGDAGFLLGFGILLCYFGNSTLPDLWSYLSPAGAGQPVLLPDGASVGVGVLTLAAVGLFIGAAARSAQFPLHLWLADETQSPVPVSALVQSVTAVAAGVYLIARLYPILTPAAKLIIAIIGVTTLSMGALISLVQRDIKGVLTFSTISQVGYMVLALGVGSWVGSLFHLIVHAFCKSLLFLGAGSIVFALRQEQVLDSLGGLGRKLPVTAITFAIAALSLAGFPYLAGSYSKWMIVSQAGAFASLARNSGHSSFYMLLFILPAAGVHLTALAMVRLWMLIFAGTPRNRRIHEHAREHPVLWLPLIVLAILSIFGGRFLGLQALLDSAARESEAIVRDVQSKEGFFRGRPGSPAFHRIWHDDVSGDAVSSPVAIAQARGEALAARWVKWAFVVAIAAGVGLYSRGGKTAARLSRLPLLRQIHEWLDSRMYFEEMYANIFVAVPMWTSKAFAWFDCRVLDGPIDRCLRNLGSHSGGDIAASYQQPAVQRRDLQMLSDSPAASLPSIGRKNTYWKFLIIVLAAGLAGAVLILVTAR